MQGNFIEAKDILAATRGGLDIIILLYPQAEGCDTNRNKKFKLRDDEKTASAHLLLAKDNSTWLVKDFGDAGKARDAIACFMDERGLKFYDALKELGIIYHVLPPEVEAEAIRADYSERPAEPDEKEGKWSWEVRATFTDAEIELIISKKVLDEVKWKKPLPATVVNQEGRLEQAQEEKILEPYNRIRAVFQEYNWHPLVSYSFVKNRKVMTFASNDNYPIFLIDEGSHQKIYQPKHHDKGRRFMYSGEKPADFIHGFAQLEKLYKVRKKRIEEEASEGEIAASDSQGDDMGDTRIAAKGKKKETAKIDELILCTGGSDAINMALLGYRVIWLNSETAKLHQWQYDKLKIMADKLYQLPDIDATGIRAAHELAMLYMDLYTIELPKKLLEHRDRRGNPCKDVRDYLNHYARKDFKLLIDTALPYRFWDVEPKFSGRGENKTFSGYGYAFNPVHAYNFLHKNGFGRLLCGDMKTEWMFVHNQNGVVRKVDAGLIEDFVHEFLESRFYSTDLKNAIIKTTGLNATSLAKLKKVQIDFKDHTSESQFFFFQNKTVEVTAAEVLFHKPGTVNKFIWEDDLLKHHIEKVEPPFKITKDEFNTYDIEILDKKCPFLKYLVQTSRIHWRKELEENLEGLFAPKDRDKYLLENHCTIAGENLTTEEIAQQKENLISKLFCIGYLLHRYKARNKAWFVWAMDWKMPDDGGSHGGSGKSILFDVAMRLMMPKNLFINGRNPKLNDDQFKYDGLSEHDRYILVEDAHQYVNLDIFYPDVTSDIKVNPKGKTPFTIPFERAAKIAFTSNFSPRKLNPSTERRMVYYVCSDYYHNKGETDDYREVRDPLTDLGLSLITGFDRSQFNSFYNLMMYCTQFYLGVEEKLKPAMENVNKRHLLTVMDNLHEWGLIYFSAEAGRLDTFVIREEAAKDYQVYNGGKPITPQAFLTRLKAFCKYYSYELNPKGHLNKQGNIIRKAEARMYQRETNTWVPVPGAPSVAKEHLYIRTQDLVEKPDPAPPLAPAVQTHLDIPNYPAPADMPDDDNVEDEPF